MADQETPTGIKQLIQSMAPEAPSVKEGIVTSASPLEVTLKNDAKMVLSANSLVVPRSLTDYQVEVDLETGAGSLISKTKTDGKHTHEELSGSDDGAHSHFLATFTVRDGVLMIHNALKKGDTVYLLAFNSGKQYYILDRKG